MMFKWPDIPSEQSSAHEIADFMELHAWRDESVSVLAMSHAIARIAENDYGFDSPEEDENDHYSSSSGLPEEEEEVLVGQRLHDAYTEIEQRLISCGNTLGYPFEIETPENSLRMDFSESCNRHVVYQYLLLITRLGMGGNYRFSNISGTDLFEELCAQIAKSYLGNRAESFVFGTGSGGSFRDKITDLTRRVGEGAGAKDNISSTTKDGKLDVVAWKPFSDQNSGKLILFAQCKTGTGYRHSVTQLQPDGFCQKYIRQQPAVLPVRAFFVSEALPRTGTTSQVEWDDLATDAGLLFDRCRIIDYCDSLEDATVERIRTWTGAAAEEFLHSTD